VLHDIVTTWSGGKCYNYLNSWPWSIWPTNYFWRCLCHTWLEWDYTWL